MKNSIILFICMLLSSLLFSQSPIGAWEVYHTSDAGDELKSVVIFTDGYQVLTTYHAKTGKFISTNGGSWSMKGDMMTEKVEFDTQTPDRVGSEVSFKVKITDKNFIVEEFDMTLNRIDDGGPGKLEGAWLMSGRVVDGQEQTRDTSGPRKTMKILSGTRFQWIAYNTETKQFSGTGGGNYTTKDGKYTENIEFFSRDDSRVGASLGFDYKLVDGKWHHTGSSSTGAPLNEVWSLRK